MERSAALQALLDSFAGKAGISQDFVEASDHKYSCKCDKCLQWWVSCGGEDDGEGWSYGPFTKDEFVNGGGVVLPYPPEREE